MGYKYRKVMGACRRKCSIYPPDDEIKRRGLVGACKYYIGLGTCANKKIQKNFKKEANENSPHT